MAEQFADFLAESGFSIWQVLPLTPVSPAFGNSPYSSPSAFAGNFLFISPEKMIRDGFISAEDVKSHITQSFVKCDYECAAEIKYSLLAKAWHNFYEAGENNARGYEAFCSFKEKEKWWLYDYALFTVLKKHFGDVCWNEWPAEFRCRDDKTLQDFISNEDNAAEVDFVSFIQYIFFMQWQELHSYCRGKGISFLGDIPMFVALDSSDVWANQELFDIESDGSPRLVAGVPPDYFSATGQKWGNPLYRWDRMTKDGFRWWISRIKHAFEIYDSVRIDHFRGFCGYWAIPAYEETAQNGMWIDAPGKLFFKALKHETQSDGKAELQLIAEDLGIITDDVKKLIDELGLPGMRILMFAFSEDIGSNIYAPHNIARNSVVYTGTHDNNTVAGWWKNEISAQGRKRFKDYIGYDIRDEDVPRRMMLLALSSVADLAVIPMQDVLGLDETSRMNTPGEADGNWEWRMAHGEFMKDCACNSEMAKQLKRLNVIYGRSK
jgi:4-alpha-glucanotransferase